MSLLAAARGVGERPVAVTRGDGERLVAVAGGLTSRVPGRARTT
jgi:hypothetical protein